MGKIDTIGAVAMGTAFSYPCSDNKHDVSIVGTHLENNAINELNKNRFHSGLNLEVLKTIKFFKHESIKEVFKTNPDLIVDRGDKREYCAGSVAKVFENLKGEPSVHSLCFFFLRKKKRIQISISPSSENIFSPNFHRIQGMAESHDSEVLEGFV